MTEVLVNSSELESDSERSWRPSSRSQNPKRKLENEHFEDSSDDSIIPKSRKRPAKNPPVQENDTARPDLESEAHPIHLAETAAASSPHSQSQSNGFTIAVAVIERYDENLNGPHGYVVRAVLGPKNGTAYCYFTRLTLEGGKLDRINGGTGKCTMSLDNVASGEGRLLGCFRGMNGKAMRRKIRELATTYGFNPPSSSTTEPAAARNEGTGLANSSTRNNAAANERPPAPPAAPDRVSPRSGTRMIGKPAPTNTRTNLPIRESPSNNPAQTPTSIPPLVPTNPAPPTTSAQGLTETPDSLPAACDSVPKASEEQRTFLALIQAQNFPKRLLFRGTRTTGSTSASSGHFRIDVSRVKTTDDLFAAMEQDLCLEPGSQRVLGVHCHPAGAAPAGRILVDRRSEGGLRAVLGFVEELRWNKMKADEDCVIVFQGGEINWQGRD